MKVNSKDSEAESLLFHNKTFDDESLVLLDSKVKAGVIIESLHFTCHAVSQWQISTITTTLTSYSHLKTLRLNNLQLDASSALLLTRFLAQNNSISYLSLASNPLGSKGVASIINSITFHPNLRNLDLKYTKINDQQPDDDFNPFLGLYGNNSITIIDLESNELDDRMAEKLAACLAVNKSLQNINLLFNNKIGARGVSAILDAIKIHKTLLKLNLGHNSIGDEGAIIIAKFLSEHNFLVDLRVYRNHITALGVRSIINEAVSNNGLTSLEIYDNHTPMSFKDELPTILSYSKSITSFHFIYYQPQYTHMINNLAVATSYAARIANGEFFSKNECKDIIERSGAVVNILLQHHHWNYKDIKQTLEMMRLDLYQSYFTESNNHKLFTIRDLVNIVVEYLPKGLQETDSTPTWQQRVAAPIVSNNITPTETMTTNWQNRLTLTANRHKCVIL